MMPSLFDMKAIAPQLLIMAVGMFVLVADAVRPTTTRRTWANLCVLGLAAAAALVIWQWPEGEPKTALYGMVSADQYTAFFNLVFLLGAAISVLLSADYLEREGAAQGEFYALLMFTTVGMMVMASAMNLIAVFLGLEILSISLYVMAGYLRERLASEEAALKYFLLGAFSSAFFLYGIALVYGATESLNLQHIYARIAISGDTSRNYLLLAGVSLMVVGFGFKVAVVPFHVWTPDVYEGAPTPVTAFMSVGAKAAGFAAFVRVVTLAFPPTAQVSIDLSVVLASISALTMIVGNTAAIAQRNIKRMLAYSSIAHAGYILLGLVAALRGAPAEGVASVLFYTVVYTFSNLGAFAVVLALRKRGEELVTLDDYTGLGFRYKSLGALMALFMFSLAGMPPTAGFFGKLYLFRALLDLPSTTGMPWLAVVAVLTSVVSFFYYLRVVTNMYLQSPKLAPEETEQVGGGHLKLGLLVAAAGTLLLGVLPAFVLDLAHRVGVAVQAAQMPGFG